MTPEQILKEISKIRRMEEGSITLRNRKNRHGKVVTYYNHNIYQNGRTRAIYVEASEVPALKKLTEAHQRFRELVEEYADLIIEQTRRERQMAKNKSNSGGARIKVAVAPIKC